MVWAFLSSCYNPHGGAMTLTQVLKSLKAERQWAQSELEKLDQALTALGSLNSIRRHKSHRFSTAARRKIAAAQKARWARWRVKHD